MNKNAKVIAFIVIVIVIIGIIWYGRIGQNGSSLNATSTPSAIPVSETSKVSGGLSEYKNSELGFAVKYPTTWEAGKTDTGIVFEIPMDDAQVSTIGTLKAEINAVPGKCAFPPVTTVKDRATLKEGDLNFNMISMTNTVQDRSYFNRMYSLQEGAICYLFSFSAVTVGPASKNLTGSNLTQAENNNKAILNTADTQFTDMVKSFKFVTGPQGKDETDVTPIR